MTLKRSAIAVSCLLLALAAGGSPAQVALPDMGASSAQTLPNHQARQLGREAYRTIRQQTRVLDDPLVTEWVESLGYRLVAMSREPGQEYTFFVVADSTVNAFAIPGGYIGIHSGLITTTEKESELAAVLAHEVAHVTQDHIARIIEDMQQVSLPVMLGMLGVILASGGNAEVAQAALATGQAALIQRQINFTRSHEAEADRIGIQTLADAGYDPESMADFFHRMDRVNLAYGKGPSEFLRTHPVNSNRIAEAKGRARQLETGRGAARQDRQQYLLMRERIRALSAEPAVQALDYYRATQPEKGDQEAARALRYGRAVTLLRMDRHEEALELIRGLLEEDEKRLAYRLALAEALLESGARDEALGLYREMRDYYGGRYPVNSEYARALMATRQPDRAERLLRDLVAERPEDAELRRRYAHAADDAGARVDARIAIAEAYYLEGRFRDALQQLKQAQDNPQLDNHERQRLSARFDEMWKRLSEDQQERLEHDFPSRG